MTTTQFILLFLVLFGLFQAVLWTWNHPTEWIALKERIKGWFR